MNIGIERRERKGKSEHHVSAPFVTKGDSEWLFICLEGALQIEVVLGFLGRGVSGKRREDFFFSFGLPLVNFGTFPFTTHYGSICHTRDHQTL